MTPKIMVSACLMGHRVRYDGKRVPVHPCFVKWNALGWVYPFCAEVEGGLGVPRKPCEIVGGDGADVLAGVARVIRCDGLDVTGFFLKGAKNAEKFIVQHQIVYAVMKDGSPSCGSHRIYDGSFSKIRIPGKGVAVSLLYRSGVRVFSENDIDILDGILSG